MPVNIRLMRMGTKRRAFYRIVAADSRRARDGKFLELIGTYDPITNPAVVKIKEDKLTSWLNEGAQPTDTVKALLTQIGYTEKYHKAQSGQDVSEIILKEHITERKKKTRKIKKAALVAEEAAKTAAAEKAKAAEEAAAAKAKAAEEAAAAKAKATEEAAAAKAEEKTEE